LPFESKAARIAGSLKHRPKAKGEMIGAYDLLIAATALNHGLILATNNLRVFNRVEGLVVERWG
jgi:tRNA(fMet)-specific endonuclease VapC